MTMIINTSRLTLMYISDCIQWEIWFFEKSDRSLLQACPERRN